MPSIEKHVEISLKRTGRKYLEVHEWIDDPANKNARNDITAIPDNFQMFKEKYGEEAAREYVQHLFAVIPFFYLLVHTYNSLLMVRFLHGFATAIYGPVIMAVVVDMAGKKRGVAWRMPINR
jgi:hypothetical protein